MDDSISTDRRRFLQGAGLGSVGLLAGCSDQLGLGGDDGQAGSSQLDGDGVAAIAGIDQEAMQEEQASLQQAMQEGDMTQEEAQQELMKLQQKYMEAAVESLVETIENADGVSVGEQYDGVGAVAIEGEPKPILQVLMSEDVQALVAVADIESQLDQQQPSGN